MPELFGSEIELITRALDNRIHRNNLIASNLANADTPGYKAVKIKFEEILQELVESKGAPSIRSTHPKHFSLGDGSGENDAKIEVVTKSGRRDGNSVDVDKEVVDLSVNQILYNANIEAMTKILTLLEYSIQEGGL